MAVTQTVTQEDLATHPLTLTQELILMLLNEETGYFHQVPGWDLNCAVVGAVLAELSLRSCIDTDEESLFLVDETETGNPALDPILKEIAAEPVQQNTQYWIERFAPRAESIIDSVLNRLVDLEVLEHHNGEFWTLSPKNWHLDLSGNSQESTANQFIKTRISKAIFTDAIPDPRDAIIISLINTCDVFRFIFELDDKAEKRIEFICNMDLIGRSIAAAVSNNLAGPVFGRSALTKKIPTVPLRKLLFNPHIRNGNTPALFADLAQEYGPVFALRPPFAEPMIFLAGPQTNRWVHRYGRMYLRARNYFWDFEQVYGASGYIAALDGAEHFRLRRSLQPSYSHKRLEGRLDDLYRYVRKHMANWTVGDSLSVLDMSRKLAMTEISQLALSVDTQDIIAELIKYKERAMATHLLGILPKFFLRTPAMRRRTKYTREFVEGVLSVHTAAQRAGCPRDLADDLLSLHTSDPQLMPESNLHYAFTMALMAGVYSGDMLGFAVYAMASQPALQDRIQSEADALFANGDPDGEDFTPSTIDVTHRFLLECMRLYPVVPMSIRNVVNTCVVEGYELPKGSRIFIGQTVPHYMADLFPDPLTFDIDRYLPPRSEHRSPGYAPYGLGTHKCLGFRWLELQTVVNVLMLAHYFRLEMSPPNSKIRISPFPGQSPSKKLKVVITEQKRDLPV